MRSLVKYYLDLYKTLSSILNELEPDLSWLPSL